MNIQLGVESAFSQSGAVGNTDNKKPDKNQKYDYIVVAMDGEYLNEMSCQHGWIKRPLADFMQIFMYLVVLNLASNQKVHLVKLHSQQQLFVL